MITLEQEQTVKTKYVALKAALSEGEIGVGTTDWTDHGRGYPNPHTHPSTPNPTGGTPKRGKAR